MASSFLLEIGVQFGLSRQARLVFLLGIDAIFICHLICLIQLHMSFEIVVSLVLPVACYAVHVGIYLPRIEFSDHFSNVR